MSEEIRPTWGEMPKPIATDIYERKEMMANGEAGNVYDDISHALETGNYHEFESYFGDEDPFSYL